MSKNLKRYERKRGKREAVGKQIRTITFSWVKLDINQGQSVEEWERDGLLSVFCQMMRQIGQYNTTQVYANQMIKQYTKVGFPPDSKFEEPKHVSPSYWAVIHIKPKSKEVVVGYIEDEIYYIVFLDKEHHFWPTKDIQKRGKTKR
ncbi:hypothetical protein I215_08336 [Galbibacter marinus]|uniref:Uncharacterized protein n=1 Tax=Galbibacter marinus TaxID=555500 RepID=K2P2I1_9FLAO|nr:hypothetical protein [Galbibacter marinus]EKF55238.1 hypothetical protein I215_08336 [Galbibacter marinus]